MDKAQERRLIQALLNVQRENRKLKQRIELDKSLRKALYSMLRKSISKEFISGVEAISYRIMMNKSQQLDADIIKEYFKEITEEVEQA